MVGAYLYFTSESSSAQGWQSDSIFTVGPVRILPGEDLSFNFTNIPRPPGAISVSKIEIQVLDAAKNITIPLYSVYNHHIYILDQNYFFIAGSGAEESFGNALDLPPKYIVPVAETDSWNLFGELINIWGVASHAPIDVMIQYHVYFSTPDPSSDIPVAWTVVGDPNETDIPGVGDSIWDYEYSFTWDKGNATIVVAQPHAHIGAINITLWDVSDSSNPKEIATAVPQYEDGYIIAIDPTSPFYNVAAGASLRITASYDNSKSYGDVMNLFQLWGTYPPDNSLFVGDAPPSPSPSPSSSPSPSPSSDSPPEPSPDPTTTPTTSVSNTPSHSPAPSRTSPHSSTPSRTNSHSSTPTITPTPSSTPSHS